MHFPTKAIDLSLRHPRAIMLAVLALAVALGSQIPRITIDTDPENMRLHRALRARRTCRASLDARG
jgi:hypothetical protein